MEPVRMSNPVPQLAGSWLPCHGDFEDCQAEIKKDVGGLYHIVTVSPYPIVNWTLRLALDPHSCVTDMLIGRYGASNGIRTLLWERLPGSKMEGRRDGKDLSVLGERGEAEEKCHGTVSIPTHRRFIEPKPSEIGDFMTSPCDGTQVSRLHCVIEVWIPLK
ncbi:hypothetical protein Tco_1113930 [Tanacetum coccineum]|uniref:FHA domain-containing protein n=1 Tax=Tanacetum coccineum TaxID=301880 RepID=A0ABQ5ITN8_9ASTR